jgi:hypothetical protein
VDLYRRALQKGYVARLEQQVFSPEVQGNISDQVMPFGFNFEKSDMKAILKQNLQSLLTLIKRQAANPALDKLTKLHYEAMVVELNAKFEAEKKGELN